MKLKDWLQLEDISESEFAADIVVGRQLVSKWCLGKVIPSYDNMRRIYALTAGEVSADDFYDLDRRNRRRTRPRHKLGDGHAKTDKIRLRLSAAVAAIIASGATAFW